VTAPPSVVLQYQRALESFRRQGGGRDPLLKRMSELISLLDFTTTLSSSLSGDEILDAALLMLMGELQTTRGCLLVRGEDDRFRVRVARGLPDEAPVEVTLGGIAEPSLLERSSGRAPAVFSQLGLEVVAPVFRRDNCIAALGLGPRAGGRPFGAEESAFLRSVAACAATPIENGLIYEELRRLNRRLSAKVFQLHNLFDLSRELVASFDEEAIQQLVMTTLMGHLMVSRAALYLRRPEGLVLAHARGLPAGERGPLPGTATAALDRLVAPADVAELPVGALRERLLADGMALAVPVTVGQQVEGVLAVGERVSRAPFGEEDREFAQTLARQALAALESVRLHRVQVEKQRQDKELQIAREIQRSLFPSEVPSVPGFEIAATSRSCYEVGGDHYDFIPLEDGRLAFAVADVSGKGTPASILMASVHASLRALAGSAPIPPLMDRLNRFLFESTQLNRYATLFYAELDPRKGRLGYANAGHIPPYRLSRNSVERLEAGGPALGMLEGTRFDAGETALAPGDVLAVVTDGVTEALSPDDREFGDGRVVETLRGARTQSASAILEALVAAVETWTGERGCSDDLTALVLKAV
jgi:sigma-B regulation protein RsbU (phosphoserine phosphatase)